MTVERIDPVLVAKAAKALHDEYEARLFPNPADRDDWDSEVPSWRQRTEGVAEVVIRVVFDELGLKGERRRVRTTELGRPVLQSRFVTNWRSVDQEKEHTT
jgi:hypothetical protein